MKHIFETALCGDSVPVSFLTVLDFEIVEQFETNWEGSIVGIFSQHCWNIQLPIVLGNYLQQVPPEK